MSTIKELKEREQVLRGEIAISQKVVPASITGGSKRNSEGVLKKYREQINDIQLIFSSLLAKAKEDERGNLLDTSSVYVAAVEADDEFVAFITMKKYGKMKKNFL